MIARHRAETDCQKRSEQSQRLCARHRKHKHSYRVQAHLAYIVNHCLHKSIFRIIGGSDVYHIEGSILLNGSRGHVIAGNMLGFDVQSSAADGFNG